MGFNQIYSAIEKLWTKKFENQIAKREGVHISRRIEKLKTFFQEKDYEGAKKMTRVLFEYFARIGYTKSNQLSQYAQTIANQLWNLEGDLEKKIEKTEKI